MGDEIKTPDWPKAGERYVWEMAKPHAAQGLLVTEVRWNGEEWVVQSVGLTPIDTPNGEVNWNTLDRFREACRPYRGYLAEHPAAERLHEAICVAIDMIEGGESDLVLSHLHEAADDYESAHPAAAPVPPSEPR